MEARDTVCFILVQMRSERSDDSWLYSPKGSEIVYDLPEVINVIDTTLPAEEVPLFEPRWWMSSVRSPILGEGVPECPRPLSVVLGPYFVGIPHESNYGVLVVDAGLDFELSIALVPCFRFAVLW